MPADFTGHSQLVSSGEPDLSSCPVTNLPSTSKHLEGPAVPTQCEPHKTSLGWYCQTCDLPGCAECMLQDHELHETVKVTNMARNLEPDLLALSKLAAKRLATLQNIASDAESHDTQIDIAAAQACREIIKTADCMRALITEHEKELLEKVNEAREAFKKQTAKSRRECDVLKATTFSLNMSVERLKEANSPLRTVLHAPIAKQEMLQQQDVAVPSVQWKVNRTSVKPWETSAGNVGGVEIETSVQQEKTFQTENVILQPSLQITNLQYKGRNAVAGIAPIYGSMACVVHWDELLWVYTGDGGLKRTVSIPEITLIRGVVTVDRKQGKLAVVDGKRKVHFVTLSTDLEVQQHTTKDVPLGDLEATRISLSGQRQLIVSNVREKTFAVLTADGDELLHTVQVDDIPGGGIILESIVQTKAGYVICDRYNKKVYFTDRAGHVVHVSADCEWPYCAVVTSWGHVLITDYWGHEIKVFSEVGDHLGSLQDNRRQIRCPEYIHLDEAEGLLYVGVDQRMPVNYASTGLQQVTCHHFL